MRWLSLLLFPMAAIAQPLNFSWDNGANNPAGTTTELFINGVTYPGYASTTATIDVSVMPGQNIDAKARAIPPTGALCGDPLELCQPSIWSNQVFVTLPVNPSNVYATKTWISLDPFITDDFNRVNEAPLSGNWYSKAGINLTTNAVKSTTNSDKFVSIKQPICAANQFSEIKIISTSSFDFGPAVRVSSIAMTGYWLTSYSNGSTIAISKFSNGNYSILTSVSAQTSINNILRIEINGNVLKGYINGLQVITATDTNPIITGQPGLFIYDTSTLDDFKGGNL